MGRPIVKLGPNITGRRIKEPPDTPKTDTAIAIQFGDVSGYEGTEEESKVVQKNPSVRTIRMLEGETILYAEAGCDVAKVSALYPWCDEKYKIPAEGIAYHNIATGMHGPTLESVLPTTSTPTPLPQGGCCNNNIGGHSHTSSSLANGIAVLALSAVAALRRHQRKNS